MGKGLKHKTVIDHHAINTSSYPADIFLSKNVVCLTLYPICYIKNIASFSINNSNFQIFSKKTKKNHYNSFEIIMENRTFAPQEQMFHFS